MDLTLDLPVRIALVEFEDVRAQSADEPFRGLAACAERYRTTYAADGPAAPGVVPGIHHARDLFRALGIDPTKRRPSSEALLNRALKGKPLPRISPLVDLGNWCSLDFLLPLGLYDAETIVGGVTLRTGRPSEQYETIGQRTMSLEGRYVLADDEGPFGSPITDSKRTAVGAETTRAVVLLYAPARYDPATLETQARTLGARVEALCGGRTTTLALHDGGAKGDRCSPE